MYNLTSPYYVYNNSQIMERIDLLNNVIKPLDIKLIYSNKVSTFNSILEQMSVYLDGFSCSSLFEVLISNEIIGDEGIIHYISPCIRPDEIDTLCKLCNFITFNSLNHWKKYKLKTINCTSPGLRINPQISFIKDKRYDPCSKYSKLGVPLSNLVKILNSSPMELNGLEGVHFHTNCESDDFSPLLKTVEHLDKYISPLLNQIKWINLGGGYYFENDMDYGSLEQAVNLIRSKYDLEVTLEPGTALVQKAGQLFSRVVDIFESDGKNIVILDTTVNHIPEVLEFEYQPEIKESSKNGNFEYILAGASCLAGDKFGLYKFDQPLGLGDKITFMNVGAYSLVKAHMFNGINLPSIYMKKENGNLELIKEYDYEDFLSRCGVELSENIRKRA